MDWLRLRATSASAQTQLPPNLLMPSAGFLPPALKAIHINPRSPLEIDFIIDSADASKLPQVEVDQLVQYFLATMTTPEKDIWVNLSPYESKRIIAPGFGQTSAGRQLLAQDHLLKQLAASLTYPESETGKAFWARVYQKAITLYGTTAIPIDTFQRVWIMPERAVVYEYNGTAFITESRLKVLLEDDYLALKNAQLQENDNRFKVSPDQAQKVNNLSAAITREIVLPELEKEINEGKNFASLRQIFHALILATWFKKKLRQHILAKTYVDQKKVKGIEDTSEQTAERIYQQYLKVLKEGVYNYIREDYDAPSQSMIPRQYFSGGFSIGNPSEWLDIRSVSNMLLSSQDFLSRLGRKLLFAKVQLKPLGADGPVNIPLPARAVKSVESLKRSNAISRWMVGLISGIVLGSAVPNPVLSYPVIQDQLQTTSQAVMVDELSSLDALSTKEGREVRDFSVWDQLKAQVALQDVQALQGKINPLTKKPYAFDLGYIERNWGGLFSESSPSWVKQVIVLAFQHKSGLAEDGQIGPATQALLNIYTPRGAEQTSQRIARSAPEIIKFGNELNSSQRGLIQDIAKVISVEDVKSLADVKNPLTGKVYRIDPGYFERHWDSLFQARTYDWPQQTLVIAFQNKYGLRQDGQIGPETRKAIIEQAGRVQRDALSAPSPMPRSEVSAGPGGPPEPPRDRSVKPVEENSDVSPKGWFTWVQDQFNFLNHLLFEIFLTILIGVQGFRIYRDSKYKSSDRVELLKVLTKYLSGENDHPFSHQTVQLISRQTALADMTARAVNNEVEIIIRSTNSLGGPFQDKQRKLTETAVRAAIEDGDFRIMNGSDILKLRRLERFDTRIHMYFEMPEGEKINGKGVTVQYRGEDKKLKSFQMSASEDHFKELEDHWEEVLRKNNQLTERKFQELIDHISRYRERNPPQFKDFRSYSVVAHKMRKLSLATLKRIDQEQLPAIYRDYFYHLGQYANMVRFLLGQSATLDAYKSHFLPEKDRLNFKVLGLSIDKVYRVLTLVEHAYFAAQKNVRTRLQEYYNRRKILDAMDRQILASRESGEDSLEQSDAAKNTYSIGSLMAEFDQYSMGFEKPYAHSIVGLDLFRRHQRVLKSIKDILFLFSPFILWMIFGSSLSIWIPFVLGVFFFGVANFLAPMMSRFWTNREFGNNSWLLSAFKPEQVPDNFASPVSSKDRLLEFFTREYLPETRWSHSRFVLAATKFSEVKAIRENSYIEIRFISDSHFLTPNGQEAELVEKITGSLGAGLVSIQLGLSDRVDFVEPDRFVVYVHPTGLRIRVKNVDPRAEAIEIQFNGAGPQNRKSYSVRISNDPFKQLINQWDHFMDDAKRNDFDGLADLVRSIKEFHKPGNMSLTDFRKNAGFYHLIRDRAFSTYETLTVQGGGEVDPRARQYFLELARFATEVRFLSASFAGMDSLKGWFLPDGDFFRNKIFGVPISRALRAIFGASFLYSWARTDTLKTIGRVAAQWQTLDDAFARINGEQPGGDGIRTAIEKKLKAEFEKADFAFRYPAKNSLSGYDKHGRHYGMWLMSGFFVMLLSTMVIMGFPIFIAAFNFLSQFLGYGVFLTDSALVSFLNQPQLFGLSILNFSVVFYVIAYWINPIHGTSSMERERNMYLKINKSYGENSSPNEIFFLRSKRVLDSIWSQAFYYFSYVLGIFSPTVIMGLFLYQQIQSGFWRKDSGGVNGNGSNSLPVGSHGLPLERYAVSPVPDAERVQDEAERKTGGIDLAVEDLIEWHGQVEPDAHGGVFPEALMNDLQGLEFRVLELRPIPNPVLFIPGFVKGDQRQQLSMK